jgi:hypothetical protein
MATLQELEAQVAALTAALKSQGGLVTNGRSPVVGPLSNLLHPRPSATVAKATYFYDGMDQPSNPGTPFPALRFRLTETGVQERCIRTPEELATLGPEWLAIPPNLDLPSPLESLQDQMASLTEDERRTVMEEQKKVRLSAIQAALAALSPEELASLTGGGASKRRGRPPKVTE